MSGPLHSGDGDGEGPAVAGNGGQPPALAGPGLRGRLASGGFAVTAEIGPPRGADLAPVRRAAEALRGWVDAVNVTDNQAAHVRLSSLAGSLAVLAAGVEPVMQVTCRDRNRIALQSDLLAAGALGIPNLLLLTGDQPSAGDHPDAKPVFDLDSVQLLRAARGLRDGGRLLSGRPVDPAPSWLVGAAENPFASPAGPAAARLAGKVAAGAEFVQTQFVFDVEAFGRWMAEVRALGLHERCAVLAGVGPIRSRRTLDLLTHKLAGVSVPDEVVRRLTGVSPERVAAEGIRLCAEIIERVAGIEGVAGVHVMAFGADDVIPELLTEAGLARAMDNGPPARPATAPGQSSSGAPT